jgi:homoserine O-acetyltransferase
VIHAVENARLWQHQQQNPLSATQYVVINTPVKMRRGGELAEVKIAYETWGELNSARDNAVLLFTGLSPSAHAASSKADPSNGWWEFMLGPDKPIDTNRLFVICVNSLGSCFGSTGPSSIDPRTGQMYRLSFPELCVEDIAAAGRAVVRALDIPKLKAVIGASLGGMTALAYMVHYPTETEHLVSICSAAKAAPFAIAIRSLQREIIRNDPIWMNGDYALDKEPTEGMRLARKLGMISYRSPEEWDERFGRDMLSKKDQYQPFEAEFQIENYLETSAQRFVGTFDANSYLYLSRAMDWFDLAEHNERLIALSEVSPGKKALVIGVETDMLFPLHQQRCVADLMTESGLDVSFVELPSLQGHDAFLVDRAHFNPVVDKFFKQI